MRFLIGQATSGEIAANPNRLSEGLGIQSATSTTVTLNTQDRHNYSDYVGATIDMFGYGTKTITAYSNLVATVDSPWATIPPNGSGYKIVSQHIPPGASWYWSIDPWSSPYANSSGFKLSLQYDRSDAQDQSDMVTICHWGPGQGLGQNGCDGEMFVWANVFGLISKNNLQSPPTESNWNTGVPGTPRGNPATAPLDVGPQFVLHRAYPSSIPYSANGSIQWDGLDGNNVHINQGYMQSQGIPSGGSPTGTHQLFTKMSSMTYGLVSGGNNGGGLHFEDSNLHDAGAGSVHATGLGVNHQWLNVP